MDYGNNILRISRRLLPEATDEPFSINPRDLKTELGRGPPLIPLSTPENLRVFIISQSERSYESNATAGEQGRGRIRKNQKEGPLREHPETELWRSNAKMMHSAKERSLR
jgi:hypothetical protein